MILKRFNPLIALFDAFERFWEASYSQRRLAGIFFWVYLLALALIQARRAGLMPASLAAITPSSHLPPFSWPSLSSWRSRCSSSS